uniref:Uncharacterized protein n=1 Tax=Sparus aurata TaxID=8175 RepID=A0A671WH77_SPAAU
MVPPHQGTEGRQQEGSDLIQPRRLPHPILASHQHRALHRELLFCHRRGLLPRSKPELLCVLDNKRTEQNLQIISLRRMPQQMFPVLQYELEEKKRSEGQQNVPEFVRVRGTLKQNKNVSDKNTFKMFNKTSREADHVRKNKHRN